MDARAKSSLLWGVVGLLTFLVSIQAFELATGSLAEWPVKAAVAVAVGAVAAAATHRARPHLR